MRKSARILGQKYGLTAQEMNFILKEEGFLDGKPGDYTVTEKGRPYAEEQYNHRGTGGYAQYNRYWDTRTWDDRIIDELDISENRKKQIRQTILIQKQKLSEFENDDIATKYNSYSDEDGNLSDDSNNALAIAISALLVYGIYKSAPYVKCWWNDKAIPSLKEIKNKIVVRGEKVEKKPDKKSVQ